MPTNCTTSITELRRPHSLGLLTQVIDRQRKAHKLHDAVRHGPLSRPRGALLQT